MYAIAGCMCVVKACLSFVRNVALMGMLVIGLNGAFASMPVLMQILWTYILSQAASAVVQQPAAKGVEEPIITIPQQIAIAITEEEQIAAMALVVEELSSTPPEDVTPEDSGAKPATV